MAKQIQTTPINL